MKNISKILSIMALIVIAATIAISINGIDIQENIPQTIQTLGVTSILGLDIQDPTFKTIQCYGYYGC